MYRGKNRVKELNVFSFTEYCIPFLTTICIPPNPENKTIFISEENFWCRKINAMSSRVLTVKDGIIFFEKKQSTSGPPWDCSQEWTSSTSQGQCFFHRTDNWFDLIHCERQVWPIARRQLNMTSSDMEVQGTDILKSPYLSIEGNSADCIQWANDLKLRW